MRRARSIARSAAARAHGARGAEHRDARIAAFLPQSQRDRDEPGIVVGRRPRSARARRRVRAGRPRRVSEQRADGRRAGARRRRRRGRSSARRRARTARRRAMVLAAAALAGVDRVFARRRRGRRSRRWRSAPRACRASIASSDRATRTSPKRSCRSPGAVAHRFAGRAERAARHRAMRRADAALVAREMLAQAEHDPARLRRRRRSVGDDADRRRSRARSPPVDRAPRREIIAAALRRTAAVCSSPSARGSDRVRQRVRAGAPAARAVDDAPSARLHAAQRGNGVRRRSSSVSFGDYMTGANHVLPTGGLARSYSGLLAARLRAMDDVSARRAASGGTASPATSPLFAEAEGLPGHAIAAGAAHGQRPDVTRDHRCRPVATRRYANRTLYAPDAQPNARIDLSDNTNLWGAPPAAEAAMRDAPIASVTRYPNRTTQIAQARARPRILGVDGRPASSPAAARTTCSTRRSAPSPSRATSIALTDPTFAMIPVFARMNGAARSGAVPESRLRHRRRRGLLDAPAKHHLPLFAEQSHRRRVCARARSSASWSTRAGRRDHRRGVRGVRADDQSSTRRRAATGARHAHACRRRSGSPVCASATRVAPRARRRRWRSRAARTRCNASPSAPRLPRSDATASHGSRAHARPRSKRARALRRALRALGLDPLPSAANFVLVPIAAAAGASRGDDRVRTASPCGRSSRLARAARSRSRESERSAPAHQPSALGRWRVSTLR